MSRTKLHPFVESLKSQHFANCFNPYSDRCAVHDRPDAPKSRAKVLSTLVERAETLDVDAIWVGRDLGYRGGRRTGLALTDDVHIRQHLARWELTADRPTVGEAVAERTAAVIWRILDQTTSRIFLWNVFPLHPHEPGNPFSNRSHNAAERRAGEDVLAALIGVVRPKRIVCVGNDALAVVSRLSDSIPIHGVRHPSYGGQTQFIGQVSALYELNPRGQCALF